MIVQTQISKAYDSMYVPYILASLSNINIEYMSIFIYVFMYTQHLKLLCFFLRQKQLIRHLICLLGHSPEPGLPKLIIIYIFKKVISTCFTVTFKSQKKDMSVSIYSYQVQK